MPGLVIPFHLGPAAAVGVTLDQAQDTLWGTREVQLRHASVHLVLVRDRDRCRRAPYAGRPGAPPTNTMPAGQRRAAQGSRRAPLPSARLSSELADGSPAHVPIACAQGAGRVEPFHGPGHRHD